MIIGILIIIMILLQSGSDELKGLGGSSNNDVMSAATSANFMTRFTSVLAAIFIINCLVLANIASKSSKESIADKISKTQNTVSNTQAEPVQDKALPIAK
jgi:preprotein translocase subunit SecG